MEQLTYDILSAGQTGRCVSLDVLLQLLGNVVNGNVCATMRVHNIRRDNEKGKPKD